MQEKPEIKREDTKRYLCLNCGASMIFEPKIGKLFCPYCASSQEVETNPGEILEHDFYAALRGEKQILQPMATDAMQVSCESCGAKIIFIPPESAKQCDFCAAKIVAQPKSSDPLVAPESILPFSITSLQAITNLKSWTNSRWLAPNQLKTMAQHDRARSIYLPYWTFDANSETRFSGQRGEDYQVREYYKDARGNRRERFHTKTNWYSVSGDTERYFDDVAVPATKSVLPKYLARLDWNFAELVSYEPAYLAGHRAQVYQVSLEEGFEQFKRIAENIIVGDVHREIGGDRQRIDSMNTTYADITFKHLLVPVYAGAYHFNGKIYQIVINGKTGEVQGERPYSWLKVGCLVAAIIAILVFLISVFSIIESMR